MSMVKVNFVINKTFLKGSLLKSCLAFPVTIPEDLCYEPGYCSFGTIGIRQRVCNCCVCF